MKRRATFERCQYADQLANAPATRGEGGSDTALTELIDNAAETARLIQEVSEIIWHIHHLPAPAELPPAPHDEQHTCSFALPPSIPPLSDLAEARRGKIRGAGAAVSAHRPLPHSKHRRTLPFVNSGGRSDKDVLTWNA